MTRWTRLWALSGLEALVDDFAGAFEGDDAGSQLLLLAQTPMDRRLGHAKVTRSVSL